MSPSPPDCRRRKRASRGLSTRVARRIQAASGGRRPQSAGEARGRAMSPPRPRTRDPGQGPGAPTPWTPIGTRASDEGQHRRLSRRLDVRGLRGGADAWASAEDPARGLVYDGLQRAQGRTARARRASSSSFPEPGSAARTGRTPRPPGETFSASARSRSLLPRRPRRAAALPGSRPASPAPVTGSRASASRPCTPTSRVEATTTRRSHPSSGSGPASSTRRSTTARPRPAGSGTSAS